MDPLNKQERTEAVIKMLAFFLLAVIIVAIPMYYAFSLPEKEAEWNATEYNDLVKKLKDKEQFEKDFLQKTDSAIALFQAYQREEDEMARDKIQLRYSNATNQMEDYLERIANDSIRADLYDNVIFTYNNLFSAWNERNDLQDQLNECMEQSQSQKKELNKKSEILTEKTEFVEQERAKTIQEKEIDLINKALAKHNNSIRLAAKELGSTERKLRKRMKELGIID
ncbi:helix-turn-helix domain-containing protein [uncultured Draconibacterium sp.]|uniref:helix-turn-helix domain-containing protein n=1 Tax=uncultured Draconibacterium sp. TaxID=1573823 RepID=UPI0032162BE2